MAATPIRALRIPSTIWDPALRRAQSENVSMSELMRKWLTDYAAGRKRVGPNKPETVELSRAELTKLRDFIDKLLT